LENGTVVHADELRAVVTLVRGRLWDPSAVARDAL